MQSVVHQRDEFFPGSRVSFGNFAEQQGYLFLWLYHEAFRFCPLKPYALKLSENRNVAYLHYLDSGKLTVDERIKVDFAMFFY